MNRHPCLNLDMAMGTCNPIPDGYFTPLVYVYGLNILSMDLLLGKNLHQMGKQILERFTLIHTR
jgi:hypothetical protein